MTWNRLVLEKDMKVCFSMVIRFADQSGFLVLILLPLALSKSGNYDLLGDTP